MQARANITQKSSLTSDVGLLYVVCLVVAAIYSRVLYCGIVDPNASIEEKQSILHEYNKYITSHPIRFSLLTPYHVLSNEQTEK